MTAGKWVDGIKKFDAFQKTIEDAKLRTLSGATSKSTPPKQPC